MIGPNRCSAPCPNGSAESRVGFLRTFLDGDQHAPRCESRALVMPFYPDGIKAYGHERHTVYVGRRGKPVCRLRKYP